ncbi:DUF5994 family protein [Kitasatospora mediocidica]|uniref:DUF5994 family protein n=1 Tax=Kitasatospora mediocidica TaxID=58352 RepID=UPI0012F9C5B9|nr:DUF5994 family protein [Kitasatospora mediocidica]
MSLKPPSETRGMVDGAWWPRSRDLTSELPSLIAVLDECWARITRVTVNVRMWPHIPAEVPTGSHILRVGWFDAEQDPADLCLLSYHTGRWDLLVIPPECEPARAAKLMAAAADVHNTQSATALLADTDEDAYAVVGASRVGDWDLEGGPHACGPVFPRAA